MKTLKEIHQSQGGRFGYKVKSGEGAPVKVVGYDSDDDVFFLRSITIGTIDPIKSRSNIFTLVEEPLEIWVNIYNLLLSGTCYWGHTSKESATKHSEARDGFVRTAKFKEVIE